MHPLVLHTIKQTPVSLLQDLEDPLSPPWGDISSGAAPHSCHGVHQPWAAVNRISSD